MQIPAIIQEHISLADKVWFRTGGLARYYTAPKNNNELQHALAFAKQHHIKLFFLGLGANVLISDQGFAGLVVHLNNKNIEQIDKNLVKADAGVIFHDLIDWCLDHQLKGLEEFSGIPGTVGGSVYINIHYFDALLSQFLVEATVIHKETGQLLTVDNSWFKFGYNQSTLQQQNYFLVNATFALTPCSAIEAAYHKGRRIEIIRHRQKRYPYKNTCGSFFRNFTESEIQKVKKGKKLIFVGYYLEQVGVKGSLRHGGAEVSYQHANMIVNQYNGTSTDIINVARTMQQKVYDEFGIIPQPECQLIGFKKHPLLDQ